MSIHYSKEREILFFSILTKYIVYIIFEEEKICTFTSNNLNTISKEIQFLI